MKFVLLIFFCISTSFIGCRQKELTINVQKLEEKELRIYFAKKDFPKLQRDANGNFRVSFDTSNIVNTSTDFEDIKNLRDVFCIKQLDKCLTEDFEFEQMGFTVNGYSHFTSDTLDKEPYTNPYHMWIIKKVKANK